MQALIGPDNLIEFDKEVLIQVIKKTARCYADAITERLIENLPILKHCLKIQANIL
jgi:hypothetical protein